MTHPQLRLVSRPFSLEDHTPLHVDIDSSRLWELILDERVHLVLRRPALLELARRNDPSIMDYCDTLLVSDDYEEWFTGLNTMSAIATSEAVDRLILVYARSLSSDRRVVLNSVARILTAEHVKAFSIMVRDIAVPGEVDVTGWTKVAISTLKDVCNRFGIETIIVGTLSGPSESMSSSISVVDDMTLTPEK
ncbi:hypothetical protein EU527_09845 [Candidatus Thorarchaeota archaeon]|nr:MAG: hypothetical protein EU527_09845 [Candidatus Thorarchaeota archaeon]